MHILIKAGMIAIECLSVIVNIYTVHRKTISKEKSSLWLLITYVTYYLIISYTGFQNVVFDLVILVIILIWSSFVFKCRKIELIFKDTVGLILTGVQQVFFAFITIRIISKEWINEHLGLIYFMMSIFSFLLALLLYWLVIGRKSKKVKEQNVGSRLFIIHVILAIVAILTLFLLKQRFIELGGIYTDAFLICGFFLIVAIFFVVINMNTAKKLSQKQLELEINNKYMKTYEDLILEIRRKQHDYKNQLSALYSMHLVAKDDEQLAKLHKEYGEELEERDSFDSILYQCDNPVLCGYVYSKCMKAYREGVNIEPALSWSEGESTVPQHKIIEMLGILLDNAVEYLKEADFTDKQVKLNVNKEQSKLTVEVCNTSLYQSFQDIDSMFKLGYSTKGEGRGIGLASLKTIVKEYNGKLSVENEELEDINWLKIKVEI